MKRLFVSVLVLAALLTLAALPAAAQGRAGIDVTCTNGSNVLNGVEIVVNMRPGYTYTATALGIDGFDPVLAVLDNNGTGLCDDDVPAASHYSVHLPTTNYVAPSSLSSQIRFSPDTSGFADISLVVGGYNGNGGEFVLILEGMGVTAADGSDASAGDPFYVRITPSMITSGIPVTAYMISHDIYLDPYMSILDGNNHVLMVCDDAGASSCDGLSNRLNGYYVSRANSQQLSGYQYDAMVQYDLSGTRLNSNPDMNYLRFLMTSYGQQSYGQYVAAFHLGTTGY